MLPALPILHTYLCTPFVPQATSLLLPSIPRIYLICDELSDSEKGVSRFKFCLSLEDFGIREAKQS